MSTQFQEKATINESIVGKKRNRLSLTPRATPGRLKKNQYYYFKLLFLLEIMAADT